MAKKRIQKANAGLQNVVVPERGTNANVLSGGLSMASTGASLLPGPLAPWGAAAGAALGLGMGLLEKKKADEANAKATALNNQREVMRQMAGTQSVQGGQTFKNGTRDMAGSKPIEVEKDEMVFRKSGNRFVKVADFKGGKTHAKGGEPYIAMDGDIIFPGKDRNQVEAAYKSGDNFRLESMRRKLPKDTNAEGHAKDGVDFSPKKNEDYASFRKRVSKELKQVAVSAKKSGDSDTYNKVTQALTKVNSGNYDITEALNELKSKNVAIAKDHVNTGPKTKEELLTEALATPKDLLPTKPTQVGVNTQTPKMEQASLLPSMPKFEDNPAPVNRYENAPTFGRTRWMTPEQEKEFIAGNTVKAGATEEAQDIPREPFVDRHKDAVTFGNTRHFSDTEQEQFIQESKKKESTVKEEKIKEQVPFVDRHANAPTFGNTRHMSDEQQAKWVADQKKVEAPKQVVEQPTRTSSNRVNHSGGSSFESTNVKSDTTRLPESAANAAIREELSRGGRGRGIPVDDEEQTTTSSRGITDTPAVSETVQDIKKQREEANKASLPYQNVKKGDVVGGYTVGTSPGTPKAQGGTAVAGGTTTSGGTVRKPAVAKKNPLAPINPLASTDPLQDFIDAKKSVTKESLTDVATKFKPSERKIAEAAALPDQTFGEKLSARWNGVKEAGKKMDVGNALALAGVANNLIQSYAKPEEVKPNFINPELVKYKDRSQTARNASNAAMAGQVANARNLSGGSVGAIRANANQAFADNALRQQDISSNEALRADQIDAQNVSMKNRASEYNAQALTQAQDIQRRNTAATQSYREQALNDLGSYSQIMRKEKYTKMRDEKLDAIDKYKLDVINGMTNYEFKDGKAVSEFAGSRYSRTPIANTATTTVRTDGNTKVTTKTNRGK